MMVGGALVSSLPLPLPVWIGVAHASALRGAVPERNSPIPSEKPGGGK